MSSSELADAMTEHLAGPFPQSVTKGEDYGEVDAVMIDADIYGWAQTVLGGSALSPLDRTRLQLAAEELKQSISAFPSDAQGYYERVLAIAHLALARS
ncbi:hypothetical protein [Pengzhenrongella sicca]|uniref:Uncharacterized protein n=1 Tax=Pengzhenrongella sicca TaxID=2819238 RepID=A0A8A4ZFA8_9MICO|nr:hypothetical protein [Pengzhenrongella sicca]QTE28368.1 hypothetical protein J4E96_13390 [Pengzhenrongella sicca]